MFLGKHYDHRGAATCPEHVERPSNQRVTANVNELLRSAESHPLTAAGCHDDPCGRFR
jgi:hypothetical protein